MANSVPNYMGGLGYTEERNKKVERRVKLEHTLMVKDLMKDLEQNKERGKEVIKKVTTSFRQFGSQTATETILMHQAAMQQQTQQKMATPRDSIENLRRIYGI